MRNRLVLFLSATLVLAIMSCNKAGKTGLLVPKDALFVAHINSSSLVSKLSWEEIKQSGWFTRMAARKTDSISRKLLDNPEASGIDLKGEGFTIFVKKQNNGAYYSFQGPLKDAAAFEAFIKKTHGGDIRIAKSGDLNYAEMEDDAVISWTSSRFIVIGDAPLYAMNPMRMYGMGSSSSESQKFSTDSLLIFAKNTYALKGDDLLDNNSKFADLIKSEGDVHFFISAENLYSGFAGGMLNLMKVSDLMKDNISTATLSFDNGKISLNGHQYMSKALADILNKYPPKDVSSDVIKRLPSGDVIFAASMSYPVEGVIEILKMSGLDGLANGALGEKNITLADFANALTGEWVFAVPEATHKPVTSEYEGPDGKKVTNEYIKTDINYISGIGIKDQKTFDKIYGIFMDMVKNDTPRGVSIRNENKWLVVSSNNDLANSFLTGNNKPAYADKLTGHAFGMYLNTNKLIGSIAESENSTDSISKAQIDLSLATWQDAFVYGDYKNGEGSFKMEVGMKDKSTNSLKQLNQYADKLSALDELRSKRWDEHSPIADSVAMPPAIEQK